MKYLFRTLLAIAILSAPFKNNLNAQSITSISSPGATTTGSAGAWQLNWVTSTTTGSMIQRIDLTLANYNGAKLFFDATNNNSDWQVQFGAATSGAWKTFCQDKGGLGAKETVYIRNISTTPGTYKNTILIGIGPTSASCATFSTSVSFNIEVTVTSSGVYTWVGTSGTDSLYTTAANWSPVRTTPKSSDYLCVNLGTVDAPVKTTIDISGVTESINQFKIYDYNTVDFKCSTDATWTVGNGAASGLGIDYNLFANAVMRKTGSAQLNVVIPANDSLLGLGVIGTVNGTLKFSGAGKHTLTNDIRTTGGTLSFVPSSRNTLYLNGTNQTISGTGGTLYIDSMMNVQVGRASTTTALTLNRTLPLFSTLKLLANTTINSNTPSSSSATDWNAWTPNLQFKAATKAGAKSRGELDMFPTTAVINGGSLFEIQGTNVRSYKMFGVPLKNGVNLSQFTDNIDITGNYAFNNRDSFSTTCSYCISSAFAWYESSQSWVAFSSGNNANTIPHGTGVMIFFRGTKKYNLGNPYTDANSSIIDFKGELFSGDHTVNLDYNGSGTDANLRGYNLVSNPYPSAIDFKEVSKGTGVKYKFLVYDGRAKTYNIWDSTLTSLTKTGSTKFSNGAANNSRIIEAGASFFVIAGKSGESITFTESSKRPGMKSTIDHFKASSNNLKCNEMRLGIRFKNDSVPENDNALIQTDMNYDGIVNGKDEFDAPKMFGGFLGIGTVATDNVWMSIDRRPASEEKTYTIPVRIKTPEDNTYRISYDGCENNAGRYQVSIVDKLLNKVIPVRNGSEYTFDKTSTDAMIEDRFELLLTSNQEALTGTKNIEKNQFVIYPNPSISGEVTLVSNVSNPLQKVEIYSMEGKLVKSILVNSVSDMQKINFEGHGNYMVKMIGSKSIQTEIVIFK